MDNSAAAYFETLRAHRLAHERTLFARMAKRHAGLLGRCPRLSAEVDVISRETKAKDFPEVTASTKALLAEIAAFSREIAEAAALTRADSPIAAFDREFHDRVTLAQWNPKVARALWELAVAKTKLESELASRRELIGRFPKVAAEIAGAAFKTAKDCERTGCAWVSALEGIAAHETEIAAGEREHPDAPEAADYRARFYAGTTLADWDGEVAAKDWKKTLAPVLAREAMAEARRSLEEKLAPFRELIGRFPKVEAEIAGAAFKTAKDCERTGCAWVSALEGIAAHETEIAAGEREHPDAPEAADYRARFYAGTTLADWDGEVAAKDWEKAFAPVLAREALAEARRSLEEKLAPFRELIGRFPKVKAEIAGAVFDSAASCGSAGRAWVEKLQQIGAHEAAITDALRRWSDHKRLREYRDSFHANATLAGRGDLREFDALVAKIQFARRLKRGCFLGGVLLALLGVAYHYHAEESHRRELLRQAEQERAASLAREREANLARESANAMLDRLDSIRLVTIRPGFFEMGSPVDEPGRSSDETRHLVTLTQSYQISTTEVTQAQYQAVMGVNPSHVQRDNAPVNKVSWEDAMVFCARLTEAARMTGKLPEGYEYTLPTEAQWEYACRAGATGPYAEPGVLGDMGWYEDNTGGFVHVVAEKAPNNWGLYDMHGNVWEWCRDRYGAYPAGPVTDPAGPKTGSSRVVRGGSDGSLAAHCRSANRAYCLPDLRSFYLGFRLCLSPVTPAK